MNTSWMCRTALDELAHAADRVGERHRVPASDVRLDLTGQAEEESTVRRGGEIPRLLGHAHRIAGEGEHDVRSEGDSRGRGARRRERQHRVAGHLGGPHAGESGPLGPLGAGRRARDSSLELHVEKHRALLCDQSSAVQRRWAGSATSP